MAERLMNDDQLMERNLRSIGAHIPLPAEPSAQQRTGWRPAPHVRIVRGPEPGAQPAEHSGRWVQSGRRLALAGSAVAAATILAVLFSTPTPRSAVQAGTILSSLRDTLHRGLRVTFEDVGDKDVRATGHVSLTFAQPFTLAQLVNGEGSADIEPETVYFQGGVTFEPDADSLAGLQLQVALALSQAEQWVYVRCDDPAPLIQEAGPVGALFAGPLRNGVLLDLGGLLESEDIPGGQTPGRHVVVQTAPDTEDAAPAAEQQEEDSADRELAALVKNLLSGQATPEEIDLFVLKMEQYAAEVRVDEVQPGLYVLSARDFSRACEELDAEDAGWLAAATVQIAYRTEAGIEWASVTNAGPHRGSVRLEFIDTLTDRDRVQRETFLSSGATVIDLPAIVQMVEGAGAKPGAADEPE